MDPRFSDLYTHPAHEILYTVFFPDRIYHAQYLNATRSNRYRYNVREVRTKAQITILKGEVYLDDAKFTNFLRVEYRSARLVEDSRTKGRLLSESVRAQIRFWMEEQQRRIGEIADQVIPSDAPLLHLHYCPWTDCYQVEIWETLEAPPFTNHHIQVRQMMGREGSITRIPSLSPMLGRYKEIREVDLVFYEGVSTGETGYYLPLESASKDNFFYRNIQVPVTSAPSSPANTVQKACYSLTFRRGFYVPDASKVTPVRYRNAMMDANNPQNQSGDVNITDMRWLFQEELGGELVFFHEVTIAPGVTEGTHQHLGSEELYYIVRGTGTAYVSINDSPDIVSPPGQAPFPVVTRHVMGLDPKECYALPVQTGSVIFTKSGGVHGIENLHSSEPLVFVAFLYQSS